MRPLLPLCLAAIARNGSPGHIDTSPDSAADSAADDTASVPAPDAYTSEWDIELAGVPAGTFAMGAGKSDPNDQYEDHEVTLTHAFWIARSEATQRQWAEWDGAADSVPSRHDGSLDLPVERRTWKESAQYANSMSTTAGLDPCYQEDGSDLPEACPADPYSCPGYRLPTEAEWEDAARVPSDTAYSASDMISDVATWVGNSGAYVSQRRSYGPGVDDGTLGFRVLRTAK